MRPVETRCSVALSSLAEHRLGTHRKEQALIRLRRFEILNLVCLISLIFIARSVFSELIVWFTFLRFMFLSRRSCFCFENFVPHSMLPSMIYLFGEYVFTLLFLSSFLFWSRFLAASSVRCSVVQT